MLAKEELRIWYRASEAKGKDTEMRDSIWEWKDSRRWEIARGREMEWKDVKRWEGENERERTSKGELGVTFKDLSTVLAWLSLLRKVRHLEVLDYIKMCTSWRAGGLGMRMNTLRKRWVYLGHTSKPSQLDIALYLKTRAVARKANSEAEVRTWN